MPPMTLAGLVTKVGCMNKTATVTVSRYVLHKRTGKMLLRKKKILAHDENNALKLDDRVIIRNCPPISARKRFTLETVLKSPETERTQSAAENQATIQKSAMESAMESPTEHNGPSTTEAQPEA